jgi:hypothetical protein
MFTVDLYNNGLSLLLFNINEKEVSGIKTSFNKIERFTMQRSQFESMLDNKILEFAEIAPRDVQKEMSEIYNAPLD